MKPQEKEKILGDAVLVFLVSGRYVFLAFKNKGIGAGKLNGFGGGIEKWETAKKAAVRELLEETSSGEIGGIFVEEKDLEKCAVMFFRNKTEEGVSFVCKVHIYIAKKWTGEFVANDEMSNASFYLIDNLPFSQMMPADRYWIPQVLRGQKFFGTATYGPHQECLLKEVELHKVGMISDLR
jgi:8-oxo-dGTP diphosphatase